MPDLRKTSFIYSSIGLANIIHNQLHNVDILAARYLLRGYNPTGGNPITDADLTEVGLTRAEFDLLVAFYTNLIKFMDNQAPASANYRNTLINYSTDSF